MSVTAVAIRVSRKACRQTAAVESVTGFASRRPRRHQARVHLSLHLFGIGMIAMRKALDAELLLPARETDPRRLGIKWSLVTHRAHFARGIIDVFDRGIIEVLLMTFKACAVTGKDRSGIGI